MRRRNKGGAPRLGQSWEEWFFCAQAYAQQYGDLRVHHAYTTPDGYKLGRWIERQRAAYNGVGSNAGRLDSVQIAMLESIGMEWKRLHHATWSQWIGYARDYRAAYGDLLVPSNYTVDGFSLGEWVKGLRDKYATGVLTRKQIDQLESLGMVWKLGHRRLWMDWYSDAVSYYRANGNLLPKNNYRTTEGEKLGEWVTTQRERYRNLPNRNPLTTEQIHLLDEIGMVWDMDALRAEKWHRDYAWIYSYNQQFGHLPTMRGLRTATGSETRSWLEVQQLRIKQGGLTEDQRRRLFALGINTAPKRKVKGDGETT